MDEIMDDFLAIMRDFTSKLESLHTKAHGVEISTVSESTCLYIVCDMTNRFRTYTPELEKTISLARRLVAMQKSEVIDPDLIMEVLKFAVNAEAQDNSGHPSPPFDWDAILKRIKEDQS